MKRISIIVVIVLLVVSGVEIYKITHSPGPISTPRCANIYSPCFEITMTGQPDLQINGWKHYGDSDCVAFTSLPDGNFHGYCGIYQIKYLK